MRLFNDESWLRSSSNIPLRLVNTMTLFQDWHRISTVSVIWCMTRVGRVYRRITHRSATAQIAETNKECSDEYLHILLFWKEAEISIRFFRCLVSVCTDHFMRLWLIQCELYYITWYRFNTIPAFEVFISLNIRHICCLKKPGSTLCN